MNKEMMLFHILKEKNQVMSAASLAKLMGLSSRTIRNYVKKINGSFEKPVIFSSNEGYCLNKEMSDGVMLYYGERLPKDSESRVKYITSSLLKSVEPICVDELLADLNVSDPTLVNDLRDVGTYFSNHSLKLVKQKGQLQLIGSEQRKRTLIRKIFSEEAQDQMLIFYAKQDILTDHEVASLRNIVINKLQEKQINMNEFALGNVILHLMVAVMRLKTNQYIDDSELLNVNQETKEYQVAKEIFDEISKVNHFQVKEEEVEALRLLLVGNTVDLAYETEIDEATLNLTRELMDKVAQEFLIDLRQEKFIIRFSIHIKNLLERREKEIFNENPMLSILKNQHVMMYDLGLFVASLLEKRTSLKIPENEVAYLAMHIGILLKEEIERESISVTIVAPAYNQMEKRIIEKLEHYFPEQLIVKKMVTSYVETTQLFDTDLIISTIPFVGKEGQEVVVLTPFFNKSDIKNIEKSLHGIRLSQQINAFQQMAEQYFDKDYFYYNVVKESKEDYIEFLGRQIIAGGIIDDVYYQSILSREKMSSTAFGSVAIPHSLYRSGKRSMFSVLFNDEPIQWNDQPIQLILLMVVSEEEQARFYEFLQLLIELFSEQESIQATVSQRDYAHFIETIKDMIKQHLESE